MNLRRKKVYTNCFLTVFGMGTQPLFPSASSTNLAWTLFFLIDTLNIFSTTMHGAASTVDKRTTDWIFKRLNFAKKKRWKTAQKNPDRLWPEHRKQKKNFLNNNNKKTQYYSFQQQKYKTKKTLPKHYSTLTVCTSHLLTPSLIHVLTLLQNSTQSRLCCHYFSV